MVRLSQLAIYPVKSCAQVTLQSVLVDSFGLSMDRRWMVVDASGKFMSQRVLPRMCLIQSELCSSGLKLEAPSMPPLTVNSADCEESLKVTVWADTCSALDCGDEAASWLSSFLDKPCRLSYFPNNVQRQVDLNYANQGDITAFSDGFPFLLVSEASLDDLNRRIQQVNINHPAIEMRRFRPNIVVSGCEAFAEDDWSKIQIGEIVLRVVKPCSRCVIPSIDPDTSVRGNEPLQTLKTFRLGSKHGVCGQTDQKIYFGQNVIAESTGIFEVGMPVKILA